MHWAHALYQVYRPCGVHLSYSITVWLQVEFWRKGASHQQEEQEQDWLQHGRREHVDTSAAAVAGSGGMMSEDMARCAGSAAEADAS